MNVKNEISQFLDSDGRLTALPSKHKKKLVALWYLAEKVQLNVVYTERQINDLLNQWTTFGDPATLRREMYDRYLLNRTPDCREYCKECKFSSLEEFVAKYI